jgi:holo-[acyl-carrier protein] synthase
MRILGHGIDIVELSRVDKHLSGQDDDWIEAVFTGVEQGQADPPPNRNTFFAGRYAAKEAVAKALSTGFSENVAWRDVEILRSATGVAEVRLASGALEIANGLGVSHWFLSISHTGAYAVASAIAVDD